MVAQIFRKSGGGPGGPPGVLGSYFAYVYGFRRVSDPPQDGNGGETPRPGGGSREHRGPHGGIWGGADSNTPDDPQGVGGYYAIVCYSML